MSDHERWADVAGSYVLEAMPPGEREAFEAHLATCPACREEVDELGPAAAALPMASPQTLPPPELKDRIMAEVEREAALLAQAGDRADRPEPARQRRRLRLPALGGWRLAPVAAALLIAGGLAGSQLNGTESRTLPVTVASKAAPNASAELHVRGGEAMLVAKDLPAPPGGRVYQVWVMEPGSKRPKPTDALFVPRHDGSAAAAIPGDVRHMKEVLVTDEPPGGSEQPTGTLLLSATTS